MDILNYLHSISITLTVDNVIVAINYYYAYINLFNL